MARADPEVGPAVIGISLDGTRGLHVGVNQCEGTGIARAQQILQGLAIANRLGCIALDGAVAEVGKDAVEDVQRGPIEIIWAG